MGPCSASPAISKDDVKRLFNFPTGCTPLYDSNDYTGSPFFNQLGGTLIRHEEESMARGLKSTHRRDTFPRKHSLANLKDMPKLFATIASDSGAPSSVMANNIAV
jgi:hypothetical protein